MKHGHESTRVNTRSQSPGRCLIVQLGKNLSVWTGGKLGVMGATWITWRTTTTVIITILQIQGGLHAVDL